jgi:hypothetical protein
MQKNHLGRDTESSARSLARAPLCSTAARAFV